MIDDSRWDGDHNRNMVVVTRKYTSDAMMDWDADDYF
jgi:hypothetical protein